jgi:hypothetical protein
MSPLLKKMNFKDHKQVVLLDLPNDLGDLATEFALIAQVQKGFEKVEKADFVVIFATKQEQVDAAADLVAQYTEGDAAIWFAYPKGSSKRYKCDFNRDTGWKKLGELGFEPVRQVAIDDDWSALRFRRVGFIKTMTRSFAMTEEGKARIKKYEI